MIGRSALRELPIGEREDAEIMNPSALRGVITIPIILYQSYLLIESVDSPFGNQYDYLTAGVDEHVLTESIPFCIR